MLEAVKAANVPAELSLSAGTFLCNQVLYTALHHIETHRLETHAPVLSICPPLPEQVATQRSIDSFDESGYNTGRHPGGHRGCRGCAHHHRKTKSE